MRFWLVRRLRISFGFCALLCFLGWLDSSVCCNFLFGIAVHEFGHLLMIRFLRVSVRSVSLHACGAVIETEMMNYRQELIVALAGPFFSIISWLLLRGTDRELSFVCLLLGFVNLIPVFPLDGGRMLRCLLNMMFPPQKAHVVLRIATTAVCCVLMILACTFASVYRAGLWPIFAALIILWRIGQASMAP